MERVKYLVWLLILPFTNAISIASLSDWLKISRQFFKPREVLNFSGFYTQLLKLRP